MKVLKWIGIVLGGLVGLIVVALVVIYIIAEVRLNQKVDVQVSPVVVPSDEASLARGEHLAKALCADCHGDDLGGVVGWFPPSPMGSADSANLTTGTGGVGNEFTPEDYVRVIRHGVDPQGKKLFMPPVIAYQYLSDEDLGAIVAYVQTVPPVNRETQGLNLALMGKLLYGVGMLGQFPADVVDHNRQPSTPVAGVTVEYGGYMTAIAGCRDCHGPNLAGGKFPDPTVDITVPSLTPGGNLASWQTDDFLTAFRTGQTPDGRVLNVETMPWKNYGRLTDDELSAMFLYLQSLPVEGAPPE